MSKAPEGMRWSPLNGKYVKDVKVVSKVKVVPTSIETEPLVKKETKPSSEALPLPLVIFTFAAIALFIFFKLTTDQTSYAPAPIAPTPTAIESPNGGYSSSDDVFKLATNAGFALGVGRSCGMSDSELRSISDKVADKINTMTNDSNVRYNAVQKFTQGGTIGVLASRNMSSSSSDCVEIRAKLSSF